MKKFLKKCVSGTGLGVLTGVGVVLLWAGSWMLIDKFVEANSRGTFGDKFGAVNSLFSGLAFTGIIWTLILQRKDIVRQRQAFEKQQFESSLFQLLDLHTSVLGKLDISAHRGNDALGYFSSLMKSTVPELEVFYAMSRLDETERGMLHAHAQIPPSVLSRLDERGKKAIEEDIEAGFQKINQFRSQDTAYHQALVNASYERALIRSHNGLMHYFRSIYHIFKYIANSPLAEKEKMQYASIVRAQLSDDEMIAIFYNCYVNIEGRELGFPKMARLAKRFSLFQNINKYSLLHEKHLQFYENREINNSEAVQ